MTIAYAVHRSVLALDHLLSKGQIELYERNGSLVSLYFHSLFSDDAELRRDLIDPQQGTTVDDFRGVIKYFKDEGFEFVSPDQIVEGLDGGRYAHLTFDDGYYNNVRALPALEEFQVPSTFFISAGHIQTGRAFWWDVLYRARKSQGKTDFERGRELAMCISRTTEENERLLLTELGPDALRPLGELDRPMNVEELREFAEHPLVNIGNHTVDHAVLTLYEAEAAARQIAQAQAMLKEMTGAAPVSIAYPNGNYSSTVVQAAKAAGLRLGFGTEPRKEYTGSMNRRNHLMHLGRFCPFGGEDLVSQCAYFRSDVMLYERYQRTKNFLKGFLTGR